MRKIKVKIRDRFTQVEVPVPVCFWRPTAPPTRRNVNILNQKSKSTEISRAPPALFACASVLICYAGLRSVHATDAIIINL